MVKKNQKKSKLSEAQRIRLENYRPVVKAENKIPQHELDRRERERVWKENKMKNEPIRHVEKKENISKFKLDKVTKQFIWDFFYEITNSGSRNNEPRARFRPSINNSLSDQIKEKIKDDKDLTKYFTSQINRRNDYQINNKLSPVKQP